MVAIRDNDANTREKGSIEFSLFNVSKTAQDTKQLILLNI